MDLVQPCDPGIHKTSTAWTCCWNESGFQEVKHLQIILS